jgi:hypothetical protein
MLERATHARAVATAKGRRAGRPSVVNPNQLDHAHRLPDEGGDHRAFTTASAVSSP